MRSSKMLEDAKKGSVLILIIAFLSLVIGIAVLINPLSVINYLLLFLALGMFSLGILDFARNFRIVPSSLVSKEKKDFTWAAKLLVLIRGILGVILGVLSVVLIIIDFSTIKESVQILEIVFSIFYAVVSLMVLVTIKDARSFFAISGIVVFSIAVLLILLLINAFAIIALSIIAGILLLCGLGYVIYFVVVKIIEKKK